MLALKSIHHIVIIAVNYQCSRHFYCSILGLQLISEYYLPKRYSWKACLALNQHNIIELFSFASAPARLSYSQVCELRHLAFSVFNIAKSVAYRQTHGL